MLPQNMCVCRASGVKRRRSNYWGNSDILRERVFSVIYIAFLENEETIIASHKNITPGKIVDKMLHAYSTDDVYKFLADDVLMGRIMYEMYEKVLEDETTTVRRTVF